MGKLDVSSPSLLPNRQMSEHFHSHGIGEHETREWLAAAGLSSAAVDRCPFEKENREGKMETFQMLCITALKPSEA